MGQFSWLYSNTGKQMVDGKQKDSYLLVPEKFQKEMGEKWLLETCYDGYGNFCSMDIWLLAEKWNRAFIPEILKRHREGNWHCSFDEKTERSMADLYAGRRKEKDFNEEELRWIGICMACYDEDNFALPYPIKITDEPMEYRDALPSESDPDQGWETSEEDDEDECCDGDAWW